MSVQELSDGFPGRGGSSMRLPLRHHHGNAFPISSSSSSSSCSSSSCMGESSPESLRSLSSLSGGRTRSPLDYDVLEAAAGTDVVLSKWTPEDERRACDEGEGEESSGKTESNSASIYLDATSGEFLRSSWNDLTLSTDSRSHGNGGRGRSSTASDSDATEIPVDEDDDDEEEALFVSVSSDPFVRGDGGTLSHVNPATERSQVEAGPPEDRSESSSSSSPFSFDSAQDEATPPSGPPERSSDRPAAARTGQGRRDRVKANAGSWSGTSPSRSADQVPQPSGPPVPLTGSGSVPKQTPDPMEADPSPVCSQRALPRKEQCTVGKTPAARPVKVAIVPRPTRGKRPQSRVQSGSDTARPRRGCSGCSGRSGWNRTQRFRTGRPVRPAPGRGGRGDGGGTAAPPPRDWDRTGPPGPAEGGSGSPPRGEQSVPKPRVPPQSPTAAPPKPAANQQPAGRPAASRLPVKGSSPGPSPAGAGGGGISGAAGRGSGTQEHPVRRTLSPISPGSGPACEAAPQRPAPSRSRQASVQTRTPAAGLKPPTATSVNPPAARAPPAGGQTKLSASFQRSGSARFCRLGGAVDRNQPREGSRPARAQICSTAAGNHQNHQNQPLEPVSDVTNANPPVSDPPSTTGPAECLQTGRRRGEAEPEQRGEEEPGGGPAEEAAAAGEPAGRGSGHRHPAPVLRARGGAEAEDGAVCGAEPAPRRTRCVCAVLPAPAEREGGGAPRLRGVPEEQKEQHREELRQLEDRLKTLYQEEWDRALQEYQEEADRFRAGTEQQVEELRSRHEAELRSQEERHSRGAESERQRHAASVEELRSVHQEELQELRSALKETRTSLEDRISALAAETEDLNQKLRVEEERRRQILSDKNLKDSHTVYLERELESLKVVLELKNNQLHHKDKKLMEMEKLVEVNVKLEETLKKVQQENEDYRARMDKHAALSRQLSTEQALLQQTLQKESKVNKRLSMENEELLWKLHNGDLLASPRRLSPTSPYGSPRNSASFPTATPLSPR
ncbi:hypothetical protein OJAV_G00011980 [Oryzias javanicus]|uniref:Microtubule associated tumor suppressor 1b n=1 Tax=Oryzias javanicus TaxID=123683 RepID=A0A3S5K3K2_ORYJA|nr:hypothetical protein OJAV_G00011980 [Oryzias javanicus]